MEEIAYTMCRPLAKSREVSAGQYFSIATFFQGENRVSASIARGL
jgi:hypothetical protein